MVQHRSTLSDPADTLTVEIKLAPETLAALSGMLQFFQNVAHPLMSVDPPSSGSHPVGAGVGKRLRRIRWKRGMTQDGLAFQAGVDRSNISAIESGKHMPREFTLVAIAKALNCNYLWLITGAGAPGVDLETEGPSA